MKKVILTGCTKKEFDKRVKRGEKLGCYLCKRTGKDKSIFLADSIRSTSLDVNILNIKCDEVILGFPLCFECYNLLKGLTEKPAEERNEKELIVN
ncbi:hypothetical protein KKC91_05185 [bacterium]|nr:hypothetical protein [bacterium]